MPRPRQESGRVASRLRYAIANECAWMQELLERILDLLLEVYCWAGRGKTQPFSVSLRSGIDFVVRNLTVQCRKLAGAYNTTYWLLDIRRQQTQCDVMFGRWLKRYRNEDGMVSGLWDFALATYNDNIWRSIADTGRPSKSLRIQPNTSETFVS